MSLAMYKFRLRAKEFIKELRELEEKHGIYIGHQDHGAFIYFDAKDMTNERYLYARDINGR